MPDLPHIEDPGTLEEKLREIFVTGSLYRIFIYMGSLCHFSNGASRYGQVPKQLRMFCDNEKCEALTWWDVNRQDVYFSTDFIVERCYTCRNCGVRKQYYQFIWPEKKDSHNIFVKAGQWPPLTIEPSPELAKALGPEDAKLYKKGLIDFNFGHGIGAVGYFRRVLENKINALSI